MTGWGASLMVGDPCVWAVAWVAVAAQLRWILRRIGSFRWWTWALFPVCLLAFDVIFAWSAVHTVGRRSVRWRGRTVDLRGPSSAAPRSRRGRRGGGLMLELVMPQTVTVAVDVVALGLLPQRDGLRRAPPRRPTAEPGRVVAAAEVVRDGADRYRRWLRINRWKDRLPEAGALFAGGVSKRQLPSYDVAGLELFVRETRRAELGPLVGDGLLARSSCCGTRRSPPGSC